MPIPGDEFKQVLRHWASGVTVLTTRHAGGIHGMTASAFCSVSLDPPLVLVCVDRRNRTHEHLLEQRCFGIHILTEDQQELSQRCAGFLGEEGHELRDLPHRSGTTGAPILGQCVAAMDCQVVQVYDGGDHSIFVAEIEESEVAPGARPLVYFEGKYRHLADG